MKKSCLILLAHGSQDPRWREPFEIFSESLKAEYGRAKVRLAYMEFAPPSLLDAVKNAREDGCNHLLVLPLFMAGGGHVDRDIPEKIADIKEYYPGIEIEALPPVGENPKVCTAMRMVAKDALEGRK